MRSAFHGSLRKPLPVTFRFVMGDTTPAFRAEGEALLERWAKVGTGTRRLGLVDGWQLHIDKHVLRAAEAGSEEAVLREWLIRGTESGQLIRQEVASMLPGALVGVEANSTVLDMCAAPGSKTTQLVERLGEGGVVVANDVDALRAYTLVKRTSSLGARAAALVVTNHRAQCMPRLPLLAGGANGANGGAVEGGYDRIICDVPCTGDGTTRKHPEVFARWEPALAMRHHPLQLQIAMRGAALLEVGGTMIYSTCSLNPIENESVVAELLRRCGGALELCDGAAETATALAGGCAPGMTYWPVLDFTLTRRDDYEAAVQATSVEQGKRLFMRSMWPPSTLEANRLRLNRCVRLLAHRSDSGGFFVAKLTKVRPMQPHAAPRWPRAVDAAAPAADDDAPELATVHQYAPVADTVLASLAPELPTTTGGSKKRKAGWARRLHARSDAAAHVVYLSESAGRCVAKGSKLRVVHAGATVFKKQRRRDGSVYCLTAEGRALLG